MSRDAGTPRRKIRYINPRLQGGAALLFATVVAAGGTAFGTLAGKTFWRLLESAAFRGHYPMRSAYEILRDPLMEHLAALLAGVFLTAAVLLLAFARAARGGIGRVIGALRASADRDLSSPTGVRGFAEAARLGEQLDGARAATLDALRSIRLEAEDLAASGASPEEFRLRWDALKQKVRRIAP
jgi:hypothetical protein